MTEHSVVIDLYPESSCVTMFIPKKKDMQGLFTLSAVALRYLRTSSLLCPEIHLHITRLRAGFSAHTRSIVHDFLERSCSFHLSSPLFSLWQAFSSGALL